MAIEFTRKHKASRDLPLTAMIDVVFILIFFFMLTTSFLRIESMELMLPSAGTKAPAQVAATVIVLRGDDYIKFGDKAIPDTELSASLQSIIQDNPTHAFTLLVDEDVSMQRMVTVMDMVSVLGGKSLYVRELK